MPPNPTETQSSASAQAPGLEHPSAPAPPADRQPRVRDYVQPLLFPAGAIVLALALIAIRGAPPVEAFLRSFLFVTIGLQGMWAFSGHYFVPDKVAALIGWPAGSPFQTEIAFANLAFGVLGLCCLGIDGGFWLATGLGASIFLLGAASVHVREIREAGNLNPDNAGGILLTDVLTPVVVLSLLALHLA